MLKKLKLDEAWQSSSQNATNCTCSSIQIYARICLGNKEVHSNLHTAPRKRNSYTIHIQHEYEHGEVLYFAKINHDIECLCAGAGSSTNIH